MFKNLKIGIRLVLDFGAVLALLAVISVMGIMQMAGLHDGIVSVVDGRFPKVSLVREIAFEGMDNARLVRNIVMLTDEDQPASYKAKYAENLAAIDEQFKELERMNTLPKAKELLKAATEARGSYLAYTDEVLALALAEKKQDAVKILFSEKHKIQDVYLGALETMVAFEVEAMKDTGKEVAPWGALGTAQIRRP